MKKKAIIRNKRWYSDSIFGLEVSYSGIRPRPGQFFQVRVSDELDPFLNRPISVASFSNKVMQLIIRIVGRGTTLLSQKKQGDELQLLGPFGSGVTVKKKRSLILAGGIGIAPLFFLAQALHKKRIPFTLLYGAKRKSDLILTRELKRVATRATFVTEEGKKKQTVVSALHDLDLTTFEVAYACGPRAMLEQLQQCSLSFPVYAFCEDFLGCGCGLCLGCAIKYKGTYKRICEDGPVFELKWIDFNG
jgi:dihydroorotate dehydrogenase electron transfer subunit